MNLRHQVLQEVVVNRPPVGLGGAAKGSFHLRGDPEVKQAGFGFFLGRLGSILWHGRSSRIGGSMCADSGIHREDCCKNNYHRFTKPHTVSQLSNFILLRAVGDTGSPAAAATSRT